METELVFRILLLGLFVAFIGHRGYYTKKFGQPDAATLKAREQSWAEQAANLLSVPALLATAAYIFFPAWMAWSAWPLPLWLRWSGVGIAAAGFTLLQWAHQALSKNWSDKPRLLQDQALITSGPYRWVRHPIYTPFLLILSAPFFLSANWFIGGLWIGLTAVEVFSRVRFEEALLAEHFGDQYRAYINSTGRLLPRLPR